MFDPPDSGASPSEPPQPIPSLPTLPPAASATTLTLPTPEPAVRPGPPVQSASAPEIETPGFTPHLAAAAPEVHHPDAGVPGSAAGDHDANTAPTTTPDDRPAPPKRALGTTALRRGVIWGQLASIPGAFVGDYVGAGLAALSAVALIVWSAVIAVNIRRARPATLHGDSPRPISVALSWFVAPVVASVAGIGVVSVVQWVDDASFEQEGSRSIALVAAVFVAGLAVLIAMYQPYRMLARCAKWANSDSGRFRKWFVAPIIAVFIAIVIQVMASLVVLTDGADGSSSSASIGAAAILVVSFTLPWFAWVIFGSRAMRSLESGVANIHDRAIRESMDAATLDALFAGHAAAAAAVNVPNA